MRFLANISVRAIQDDRQAICGGSPVRRPATVRNLSAVAALIASCIGANFSLASGGAVLPAATVTSGYNLTSLASATALYNTGVSAKNAAATVPNIPFLVLEGNTTVPLNTYVYVPIFYADNSPPVDPAFPTSVTNQATDAAYLDNLVKTGNNITAFFAQVDGVNTVLTDSYIVGVNTSPLLDGGGTEYISDAAVLTPLSLGAHTVGYGGVINGNDVVFGSSTVTVVPEPTSLGLLTCASTALIRRRRRA